jgi:hypothetical protein
MGFPFGPGRGSAGAEEQRVKAIRTIVLAIAFLATMAPIAHLLELPSKLSLDGPLWLSVQQHLYRGWNFLSGPIDIVAFAACVALFLLARRDHEHRNAYLIAAACYLSMILYYYLFNNWVNHALRHWTVATLPANWTDYRLKWETGHALAALFAVIAFVVLLQARIREASAREAAADGERLRLPAE